MTPRLQMEKDVERVVEQHFEENWDAAWPGSRSPPCGFSLMRLFTNSQEATF
jgi:hypothetical protein